MKQAIGSSYILYFIIIFLVILFTFILGTVLYYKAYKVNTVIANALEKFEGYNGLSNNEINNKLGILGYMKASKYGFTTNECPKKRGKDAIAISSPEYKYCIYEIEINKNYYKYGVLTYIQFEVPITRTPFKIPIYSETERIYYFR